MTFHRRLESIRRIQFIDFVATNEDYVQSQFWVQRKYAYSRGPLQAVSPPRDRGAPPTPVSYTHLTLPTIYSV